MSHKIVFLDRETLDANLRRPNFPHDYTEYPQTAPSEIVERLKGVDICITNKVPLREDVLKQLPELEFIAVAATGTDVIDKAYATARGITISNIRNYAYNTLPEHVFALLFALRRNLVNYHNSVFRGRWGYSNQFCYFDYPIYDIAGSTLGIIGYGALGKEIEKRAVALGIDPASVLVDPTHDFGKNTLAVDEVLVKQRRANSQIRSDRTSEDAARDIVKSMENDDKVFRSTLSTPLEMPL